MNPKTFNQKLIKKLDEIKRTEEYNKLKPLRDALRQFIDTNGHDCQYTILKYTHIDQYVTYKGTHWLIKYHPEEGDNRAGRDEYLTLHNMDIRKYQNLDID